MDVTFRPLSITNGFMMAEIVQERLVYSSTHLTLDTYSHIVPGMQQVAAEKFDDIFASD